MNAVAQPLRVALAQLNTTVGDIDGNAAKIVESLGEARSKGAQLVVFPELAVNGYPPEDLLLKTAANTGTTLSIASFSFL